MFVLRTKSQTSYATSEALRAIFYWQAEMHPKFIVKTNRFFQVKHLLRFKNGNVQQTAKCVLSALLTDNLMLNFSWLGQRGKSSMHQCNVVKVIVGKVQYNTARMTRRFKLSSNSLIKSKAA